MADLAASQDQLEVEKRRVKELDRLIEGALEDAKYQFEKMQKLREYARGTAGDVDDEDAGVEYEFEKSGVVSGARQKPNLIYSTIVSLMPHTAARQPRVKIKPAESVHPSMYELLRNFARTCEIAIHGWWKKGRFKKKLRRSCVSAFTTGVGWLKVSYQKDMAEDPVIKARLDDTQNNIRHIEHLIDETRESNPDYDPQEQEQKLAELREQVQVLQSQVEVVIAEGFVFDRVLSEDIVLSPDVVEMDDYREAEWIAHLSYYAIDDVIESFRLFGPEWEEEVGRYKTWHMETDTNGVTVKKPIQRGGESQDVKREDTYVAVIECWHRKRQTVYTWIHGGERFIRPPWHPKAQGRQWYPFFPLMFNETDAERYPLADVELLRSLVDEFWDVRTALRQHRERAVPGIIGRKGDISETDANKINARTTGELVLIDGPDDVTKPIEASFGEIKYPPVDPGLYDTTPILQDYDTISGLQDAARGSAIRAKTATEAAIMEQGRSSRTQDRQDMVEEFSKDIAEFMLQMALLRVPHEKMVEIAGPLAVWPMAQINPYTGEALSYVLTDPQNPSLNIPITRELIYDMIQLDIEAGSSGKPNAAAEEQKWLQLMPIVMQQVNEIATLRMQGLIPLAESKKKILQDLVNRLDERLDVERWLPQLDGIMPAPGMPAPAIPMGGMPGGAPAPGQVPGGGFSPTIQTPSDQPPTNLGQQRPGNQPTPPAGPQPV